MSKRTSLKMFASDEIIRYELHDTAVPFFELDERVKRVPFNVLTTDYKSTVEVTALEAQEGDTIIFDAGEYHFSGKMTNVFKSGQTWKGRGASTVLIDDRTLEGVTFSGEFDGALFYQTTGISNFIMQDLKLQGSVTNAALDTNANGQIRGHNGVSVTNVGTNITFNNVECTNFGGAGLAVSGTSFASQGAFVKIRNCYLHNGWRFGAYVQFCTGVMYDHNAVDVIHPYDSNGDGIYDSQWGDGLNATSCISTIFSNNIVQGCSRIGCLIEGGVAAFSVDATFSDNIITGCGFGTLTSGAGIWCENMSGQVIIDSNRIQNCSLGIINASAAIESMNISNCVIILKDNLKTVGQTSTLYGAINCRGLTAVTNCTFFQDGTDGNGNFTFYYTPNGNLTQNSLLVSNCHFYRNVTATNQGDGQKFLNVLEVGSVNINNISFDNCDGIVDDRFIIIDAHTNSTFERFAIINCNFKHNVDNQVFFTFTGYEPAKVIFDKLTLTQTGNKAQAISASSQGLEYCLIDDCHFTATDNSGLAAYISVTDSTVRSTGLFIIRDTYINTNATLKVTVTSGAPSTQDFIVQNCKIEGDSTYNFDSHGSSNVICTGNVSTSSSGKLIYESIALTGKGIVSGNIWPGADLLAGVSLANFAEHANWENGSYVA